MSFREYSWEKLGVDHAKFSNVHGDILQCCTSSERVFQAPSQKTLEVWTIRLNLKTARARAQLETTKAHLQYDVPEGDKDSLREIDESLKEIGDLWDVILLSPNGPIERLMERTVRELEADNADGENWMLEKAHFMT